jgi:hypothetical protein
VDRFPAIYEGDFFYSDYFEGFLRRIKGSGNSWSPAPAVPGQASPTDWGSGFEHVSDWAVGPTGALWYCKQSNASYDNGTGEIRRITFPQAMSVPQEQLPTLLPPYASPAIETAMLPFALATPG